VAPQNEPAWPPISWEDAEWVPNPDGLYTQRERAQQTGPCHRAVLPHIAASIPLISPALSSQVEEATADIVRFDAEMGREIANYGSALLRSESAASSKIERLAASACAIATAEAEGSGSRNAAEIVANTHTMYAAIDLADRLDAGTIRTIHATLMAPQPDVAGKWRTQQVWIGAGDAGPRIADFVPPKYTSIPDLIDDLTEFTARTDMPVLVQGAIMHAQFETIHPFVDGNGRTGRALLHALLRNKGLTTRATVPISAGLLTDTSAYFDGLTRYRAGDTEPMISMISVASIRAVKNGRELVSGLRSVREGWQGRVKARRGADTWRVADLMIRRGVVTPEIISSELGIALGNVARVIAPLQSAGVIVSSAGAKRNTRVFRAPEVLSELDAFAERAGRRNAGT
jgi:Fic family protein